MLNEKQKMFADYYIETLNATQSALKAGYSKKTAYSIGNENLKKPEIKQYIEKIMGNKDKERIASQNEILELLTKIMRGEEKKARISDRLKAVELLGKRYNLFDKDTIDNKPKVVIISDVPLKNKVLDDDDE